MTDPERFTVDEFLPANSRSWSSLARLMQVYHQRFTANNNLRLKEMLRYSASGVRTAIQNIPLFIQVNVPNVPGFVEGCEGSTGIAGFERSGFARLFLKKYPDRCLREILVRYPCIQSLTLVDNRQSIGHTCHSDLDYWVFVDPECSSTYKPHLLSLKLRKISEWAAEHHGLTVQFIVITIDDIRTNRLGVLDEDHAGMVMPGLLKEELYRTLIHIAGRTPLWWTMPPEIDENVYRHIAENLRQLDVTTFNPHECIDLGYPRCPEPREYLGAAMWQTYKSIRDPFQAVVKTVLILEQVDSALKAPLLCDQIKEAVYNSPQQDLPVDPYWHMMRRAIRYIENYPEYREIVRIAVWNKLDNSKGLFGLGIDPAKACLLETLQSDWGWTDEKVSDLRAYQTWPEKRKISLGEDIKSLLLDLYSCIAAKLRAEYSEEVKIQDENLILLNAQILGRFGNSGALVDELPSIYHRNALPSHLVATFDQGEWRLLAAGESTDCIFSSSRLARVAAWLVHNQIGRIRSNLHFHPLDRPVKKSAFLNLLDKLNQTFKPLAPTGLGDQNLLSRPVGPGVLVVNLEEGNLDPELKSVELIYRTSLGEMGHEVLEFQGLLTEREKYYQLAQFFWTEHASRLSGFLVVAPPGHAQEVLEEKVNLALKELGPLQSADLSVTRSRLKLDLNFDLKPFEWSHSKLDESESEDTKETAQPKARLDLDQALSPIGFRLPPAMCNFARQSLWSGLVCMDKRRESAVKPHSVCIS